MFALKIFLSPFYTDLSYLNDRYMGPFVSVLGYRDFLLASGFICYYFQVLDKNLASKTASIQVLFLEPAFHGYKNRQIVYY
jgi:hypothetical protein